MRHIVVENVAPSEYPGIFGIEAEHQTHAQHIEAAERLRVIVAILGNKRIVELPYNVAGFHRHFKFLLQMLVAGFHKEAKAVVFAPEVAEFHTLWLTIGILHIVDVELGKIASHNPSRVLRHRYIYGISLCLLEWGKFSAISLGNGLSQVFAERLLLNHHACGGYHHINK